RITEDGTFTDMHDRECSIEPLPRIGLIHPVYLSEEQRLAWGQLFGDYEIVPPFPQLGRTMYAMGPDEEYEQTLKVKMGTHVPELTLLSGLPPLEWATHWSGVKGMARYFAGHDVTAILELSGWHERTIGPVRFYRGQRDRSSRVQPAEALMLGELDPALLSEVA